MDASASAFAIHLRQGFGRLAASADGDPLVHFVPAAGGASASSAAKGPSEGRDWRGHAMEETMLLWTISELMHLTRNELCDRAGLTCARSRSRFDPAAPRADDPREYQASDGAAETPLLIRHD
ncbi:MAG TPA: hypothetical protein VNO32_53655, partial [Candidatus Acidoferrum sp.]|nr:hypothetical protein [Candidatus Acidoferrum sp.]